MEGGFFDSRASLNYAAIQEALSDLEDVLAGPLEAKHADELVVATLVEQQARERADGGLRGGGRLLTRAKAPRGGLVVAGELAAEPLCERAMRVVEGERARARRVEPGQRPPVRVVGAWVARSRTLGAGERDEPAGERQAGRDRGAAAT